MLSTKIRPVVNDEIIQKLIKKLYGFKVTSIRTLNSYDDANYHILGEKNDNSYVNDINNEGYILKILNSHDSKNVNNVDGQNQLLLYLNENGINCPIPIKNLSNQYYSVEKLRENDTTTHIVRMFIYLNGEILASGDKISPEILIDIGKFIYKLDNTLKNFNHIAYEKHTTHPWSLLSIPMLREFLYVIKNDNDKSMVNNIIHDFENLILKNIKNIKKGIIHGDLNEQNILVDFKNNRLLGVIDFGDVNYSYIIFELAINICYMIIQTQDIAVAKYVIKGYEMCEKLNEFEKSIIKTIVCARMSQSLVLGLYSFLIEPDNTYLIVTQKSGWKVLKELWNMNNQQLFNIWNF